ncbi:MAG: helix-turn-helix domain-containing protein [Clostridia bacterium]|nr:helix-turn-helix domain-containing protein [Clostridia bacterium]
MSYEKEVKLLCDTFKRCRIPASVVSPLDPIDNVIDFSIRDILYKDYGKQPTLQSFIGTLLPNTMYRYTDEFKLCYIYLRLTNTSDTSVLFIGPYLSESLSSRQLLELGENLGVPPKSQRYFERYYSNIPVVSEGAAVLVMLDAFCEHIWKTPAFAICNVNAPDGAAVMPVRDQSPSDNFDDTLFNIKTMEMRYKFENELMQAVALGQIHKEKLMLNSFSEEMFEKRVSDPLRNAKNYSIIMNTLLRKAAEQGGVHPVHIDKMSSEFARSIEQVTSLSQNNALMREMFRSYCKLVRKHAIRNYSLAVQKTILLIDNDLSTDLSLSTLAKQQNISPAYLSSLFKKETGKTVSEYIREKRIRYAASLLESTHLQVQTVALHCGIMDVQYFSKLFKKQMRKTPKEYRAAARAQH